MDQPDPDTRAAIQYAFDSRQYTGYVNWKPIAQERMNRDFPSFTTILIEDLIAEHLCKGGKIRAKKETRPEHNSPIHYDFKVRGPEQEKIFVETLLDLSDPDDPIIHIVSCHRDSS